MLAEVTAGPIVSASPNGGNSIHIKRAYIKRCFTLCKVSTWNKRDSLTLLLLLPISPPPTPHLFLSEDWTLSKLGTVDALCVPSAPAFQWLRNVLHVHVRSGRERRACMKKRKVV
jgi:hypothetical protein